MCLFYSFLMLIWWYLTWNFTHFIELFLVLDIYVISAINNAINIIVYFHNVHYVFKLYYWYPLYIKYEPFVFLYTECILNTVFIPFCSQTLVTCIRLSAQKCRCKYIYIYIFGIHYFKKFRCIFLFN